jgi:hypothetical protein
MVLTTAFKVSQALKPLALLGLASVGMAVLSGQPASALTYGLDNTANSTNPLPAGASDRFASSTTNQLLRTFQMGPLDAYLNEISLGYSTGQTTPQSLTVNIYELSGSTASTTTTSGVLGTGTFSLAGTNGHTNPQYTTLPIGTGSLTSYIFQAGKTYGLSFNGSGTGAGPLNLRTCPATDPCLGSNFVTAGGVSIPVVGGGPDAYVGQPGSWSGASVLAQTAYMEIQFAPVPAPALMGFSSLSGLMVYSRRLRSRIKGAAA